MSVLTENHLDPTDDVAEVLADCYDDPDGFNSAVLNRSPYWYRQEEIARSVVDYRITVVYSGNAIGKDYLVGGLVPWWLFTRADSLVIVTGPGQTLLGSVTWKEIRKAIKNGVIPLPCVVSEGIKTSPHTVTIEAGWQALGYSTTTVERASGQHAEDLLVIVEEGSGVEDETWDAIDSLKFDRLVVVGNPLRPDGRFIDLIRQAEKDRMDGREKHLSVNAIQIPSTDSPHAHMDKSPWGLADKTWLDDCAHRYTTTSLWYCCHVLAIIPLVSSECLIPEAWLDACTMVPRTRTIPLVNPRMAIDLGEGVGRDSTAILVRDDLGIVEVVVSNTMSLPGAADTAKVLANRWHVPHDRISYDKLGIGKDFRHHLEAVDIKTARPYSGEGRPLRPHEFTNLRTEAAWQLRRRLDPDSMTSTGGGRPFHIPPATWWPRLRKELKELDYSLVGRKTALLLKKDWLARLGMNSPDIADALIQSFAF